MSRIFRAPPSHVQVPAATPTPYPTPIAVPFVTPVQRIAPAPQVSVQDRRLAAGSRLAEATKAARQNREAKLANMHPDQRKRFLDREKAKQEALTQFRNLLAYKRHHNKTK